MKKSNSKSKALGAFRNLGSVALITATIFFVACKQTNGGGGGKPTPKPKHAINFSVDSTTPNGTLKVEGDGITQPATSPINVEEGKTVTFTAKANDGYRVKGWTLDGKPITEAGTNTEYKLKVSKPAIFKVSFEAIPPTKYTVTLNQAEGGTVTASPAIPTDKQVAKDTVITFTAEANAGYKIGKWKVTPAEALQDGTGADGSPTAKVKITADTTVSVSFELLPPGEVILTLDANKRYIKVKAKTKDGSAIQVEGCKETTLASNIYTLTELHATGTVVILKGKITEIWCSDNQLTSLNVQGLGLTTLQELYCARNQLTELNVQGCTSLQRLQCFGNQLPELNVQGLTALRELSCSYNKLTELNVQELTALKTLSCYGNQIKAKAMTALLNALSTRKASDYAEAVLYTEETGKVEGNCKDFSQPAELKAALDGAKSRNWRLQKIDARGRYGNI